MIRKIAKTELVEVLDYLKQDLQLCLYAYIDIKKYGIDNDNLTVFAQFDEDESIKCVIMRYYMGLQIYTAEKDYDAGELVEFLDTIEYNMINGAAYLIQSIVDAIDSPQKYERENGFVVELKELFWDKNEDVVQKIVRAENSEDFLASAKLICSDEGLGGHYDVHELSKQLQERREESFGRNMLLWQNDRLVCHVATYAELNQVGIISGVITDSLARGQGLAYQLVGALSAELLNEGKRVFLFYYTEAAGRLYKKLGFTNSVEWQKLIVKQ